MDASLQCASPLCAYCQGPGVLHCANCGDAPILLSTLPRSAQYPNTISHHMKSNCETHLMSRLLYRAGDLLQDLFYTYRANVFDKRITIIENRNGKLLLQGVETLVSFDTTILMLTGFPNHLVANEEDKKAALAYSACCDASGWMYKVIAHILKDVAFDIAEFTIVFKNPKRIVVGVNPEGDKSEATASSHEVVKITLKDSREQFILDLSGAQFGLYKPIIPFQEYMQSHVDEVVSTYPLGSMRGTLMGQVSIGTSRGVDPRQGWWNLNCGTSKVLKEVVLGSEETMGRSMQEILSGSAEDFARDKVKLVRALEQALKAILIQRKSEVGSLIS